MKRSMRIVLVVLVMPMVLTIPTSRMSAAVASSGQAFVPIPAQVAATGPRTAASPNRIIRAEGRRIAAQGVSGRVPACASCHGGRGQGDLAAGVPRLASQGLAYQVRQMIAFANGDRSHPVMSPIATRLDARQIRAVSIYYAGIYAPPRRQLPRVADATLARGYTLATQGDTGLQVPACSGCHGSHGGRTAAPAAYPDLASQPRSYFIVTLAQWQNGIRHAAGAEQMNVLAARLNHDDLQALAAYYGDRAPLAPAASGSPSPGP